MVTKEVIVKIQQDYMLDQSNFTSKKSFSFQIRHKLRVQWEKKANVKSLIGVLSLGVSKDANVKVIASGDDEALAN